MEGYQYVPLLTLFLIGIRKVFISRGQGRFPPAMGFRLLKVADTSEVADIFIRWTMSSVQLVDEKKVYKNIK